MTNWILPNDKNHLLISTINRSIIENPDLDNSALWRYVFDVATKNEIETLLTHRLAEKIGWDALPDTWRHCHEETYHLILAYLNELDHIATQLADASIPLVALKNGGIARGIYPCPGCCPMGDLDVLVEKRHFRRAHEILLAEGYHFEFRSPLEKADLTAAEESGGAEYWKILHNGEKLWFELQWRPVAGRWIRPDQEPSAEELMARSPFPCDGVT